MKRIYSALAIFVAVGLCSWAQVYRSVAVNLADGSKTEVNLSDDLSATFDEENLLITGGDQDISVPRAMIKSFTFSEKECSGIDEVNGEVSAPVLEGGNMVFTGLPEGSVIAVYTAGGAMVHQATATGSYTLDLSALPTGTMLVKVNGVAYKIAVKR